MSSKKARTVKELSCEVDKILDKIQLLENTIKDLKEAVSAKLNEMDKSVINNNKQIKEKVKCVKCKETFETKTQLFKHIKKSHLESFECKCCEFSSNKMHELENHLIANHGMSKDFKCNRCDSIFVTEWRLKKHIKMHDTKNKFCHFVNNGKKCQYEELGCRFSHEDAPECKYKEQCSIKLCQFKHSFRFEENNEKDEENRDHEKMDNATEFFCEHYCDIDAGVHAHSNKDYEHYKGVIIFNISKTFDKTSRKWRIKIPCEFCDENSTSFPLHKKHMKENHEGMDVNFECKIENCEFGSSNPETLVNHYAEQHEDEIKEKLDEINTTRSTFDSVPQI